MIAPTIAAVQEAVAAEHGLAPAILREPDGRGRRKPDYVRPRQEAMYLATILTQRPATVVSRAFHRDHSTVLHGCRRTVERLAGDDELKARMRRLTLQLLRAQ